MIESLLICIGTILSYLFCGGVFVGALKKLERDNTKADKLDTSMAVMWPLLLVAICLGKSMEIGMKAGDMFAEPFMSDDTPALTADEQVYENPAKASAQGSQLVPVRGVRK